MRTPEASSPRLTSLPGVPAPAPGVAAAHNFRRLGGRLLLSNEAGRFALVEEADYRRWLAGGVAKDEPLAKELLEKGFLAQGLDFRGLAAGLARRRLLDWGGPSVHTLVVTRRCNLKCLYCHASVVEASRGSSADMSPETARKAVDLVFQSPAPSLMIEFQGGEPLLNWPVVKFVVEYARLKNRTAKKTLHFGLISNFTLLDDEKLGFLEEHGVSFCTSLDGPEDLHNANRIHLGGNGHAQALDGLRRIQARRQGGAKIDAPNAICTVTRASFGRHREIVDQLVALGIERVQFGPLDPIGFAERSWPKIGYDSAEFARFYGDALDYVIELSGKGVRIYEKMALILLIRVLEAGHWRFPNADGAARLAYGHDGGVYTCEEGRLLAHEGDEFFRIGTVDDPLPALLDHPTVRASLLAAAPETQGQCFQCAYNPFCTVMPTHNYKTQGGLWGSMPTNGWCGKMMGVLDVLFTRLQDPAKKKILESWLEHKSR